MMDFAVLQRAQGVAKGLADAQAALTQAGKSVDRLAAKVDEGALNPMLDAHLETALAGIRSTLDGVGAVGAQETIGAAASRWAGHAERGLTEQRRALALGTTTAADVLASTPVRDLGLARANALRHITQELGTAPTASAGPIGTAAHAGDDAGRGVAAGPDDIFELDSSGNLVRARFDDALDAGRDDVVYPGSTQGAGAHFDDSSSGGAFGII